MMRRSDFCFDLPSELIAQRPSRTRGESRLLAVHGPTGETRDLAFADLPRLLRPPDVLVFNDTRVMRARLFGRKRSGGRVEILIERLEAADLAIAHLRASKSPEAGTRILLEGEEHLDVLSREGDLFRLRSRGSSFTELMERHGHMPLPHYIERSDGAADLERYQTVYARREGAVAAPTAGLHFDTAMLVHLAQEGIAFAYITLHVGAGTFQPVRADELDEHVMHAEWLEVDEAVCRRIAETRSAGGRVVAVGTTSVRGLETAGANGGLQPFCGDTRLFIRPGYRFRVVDAMLTNFHLPESTLLMLVAAFAGHEQVMSAYRHAVIDRYRFFSYGDAMFLTRRD